MSQEDADEGNLDAPADLHAAHRRHFLNTPASTLDGVLAKTLVLTRFVQDDEDPARDRLEVLTDETFQTEEAKMAFAVMQDLAAMLTTRGITVERLAALPESDATPVRDGVARLTAEWLDAAAWETRMRDLTRHSDTSSPEGDALWHEACRRAATTLTVLAHLAAKRIASFDGLALKAAVVVAGCGDGGLDERISANDGHAELSEAEITVALSLVRDIVDLLGPPVHRLTEAVLRPAALPVAGPAGVADHARTAA